jgi:hypothetical protein
MISPDLGVELATEGSILCTKHVGLDEEDAARTGRPFGLARPAATVVSRQKDVAALCPWTPIHAVSTLPAVQRGSSPFTGVKGPAPPAGRR